jgi:tRNA A37 threonylcarbamoyladenosine synthetase subunit TsaC/SUA5/YrdC
VPQHRVVQAILEALGEPLLSTSLILPGEEEPLPDAEAVAERIGKLVDVIVDTGETCRELTTVVDLTGEAPHIVRLGAGDPTPFIAE